MNHKNVQYMAQTSEIIQEEFHLHPRSFHEIWFARSRLLQRGNDGWVGFNYSKKAITLHDGMMQKGQ